jgi:hypothetical protein
MIFGAESLELSHPSVTILARDALPVLGRCTC